MKKPLGATQTYDKIQELMGFSTRRELAAFFGVTPSAITDWATRKGNKIPAARLAEAARRHSLRWQWLAYGELPPYEETVVEKLTGVVLGPEETTLLRKIKESPAFRSAVNELLGLDEGQMRLIAKVACSFSGRRGGTLPPEDNEPAAKEPFLEYRSGLPLTTLR